MINLEHMNEGMENLKQIEEFENKVGFAIQELREILKTYHYKNESYVRHISKDVVTRLENLLGNLLKK